MSNTNEITRRTWIGMMGAVTATFGKDLVEGVNKARNGLAVKGYDTVAYQQQGKAVKGNPAFAAQHDGANYLFTSAANRDAFTADPERYAPQFGGYCAWAVGHGYTADIDPEAWHVADGKLYLNYNKSVQGMWLKDKAKWIGEAVRNWPGLHK